MIKGRKKREGGGGRRRKWEGGNEREGMRGREWEGKLLTKRNLVVVLLFPSRIVTVFFCTCISVVSDRCICCTRWPPSLLTDRLDEVLQRNRCPPPGSLVKQERNHQTADGSSLRTDWIPDMYRPWATACLVTLSQDTTPFPFDIAVLYTVRDQRRRDWNK